MEIINTQSIASVTDFIRRYTNCISKSSQSTLEMANVVFDAKSKLTTDMFKQFCNAIGKDTSSATISKMVKIGEKYSLLISNISCLPSSWTTLYYIAKQSDEVITADIESKYIHPLMTGKDLAKYGCHPQGAKKKTDQADSNINPSPLSITAHMHSIPTGETAIQIRNLINQLRSLGMELVIGDLIESALNNQ